MILGTLIGGCAIKGLYFYSRPGFQSRSLTSFRYSVFVMSVKVLDALLVIPFSYIWMVDVKHQSWYDKSLGTVVLKH